MRGIAICLELAPKIGQKAFFRPEKEHGFGPGFYSVHDTSRHISMINRLLVVISYITVEHLPQGIRSAKLATSQDPDSLGRCESTLPK